MRRIAARAGRLVAALGLLIAAASCAESPAPAPPAAPSIRPPSEAPTGPAEAEPERVAAVRIATLQQPLALATRAGDETFYVAQKTGEIVALSNGEADVIVDLSGEVSQGGEQGLLGITFSPDGAFLYANFTDVEGDTHVVEYAAAEGVDPATRREVLVVDQPFSNHNGGHLAFGPDGYLYIGLGDGGGAGDPLEAGQDLGTLLGKMLRIDPRPEGDRAYTVPADNPFVGVEGARPEIWAYGLRNPWRYSFDRLTGDLWIGDVGQSAREEIDVQPGPSDGGENYGWDAFEGDVPFEDEQVQDAVAPVLAYGREIGASVVGGYVYRGERIAGFGGHYVFADFYNPELMELRAATGGGVRARPLGVRIPSVASFGEDQAGELYALSLEGGVYRLVGRPR